MRLQSISGQSYVHKRTRDLPLWHAVILLLCWAHLPQLQGAPCPPRPFKIHPVYQLGNASPSESAYLREKLVPTAIAVIRDMLQVKKRKCGKLRLYPTACEKSPEGQCVSFTYSFEPPVIPDSLKAPGYGGGTDSGVNADFVLFVTRSSFDCGQYFSFARTITQDWTTNRPTSGSIEFCKFGPSNFEQDIDSAVQQMFTALGMNAQFLMPERRAWPPGRGLRWGSYIDDAGKELTAAQIVKTETVNGENVRKVITPRVVQYVRNHFACPTADGAELEDDGGPAVAGIRWDERLYNNEVMQGLLGARTFGGRSRVSRLTLKLMEDTGWYNVNVEDSERNDWGTKAGCAFLNLRCTKSPRDQKLLATPRVNRFFCDINAQQGNGVQCTSDYSGTGLCSASLIQGASGFVNMMDGCYFVESQDVQDCVSLGIHMRCLPLENAEFGFKSAECFKMSCKNGLLYATIEGKEYRCPSGNMVTAPGLSNKYGPCPKNELMCGTSIPSRGWLECPTDCSGKGICIRGQCRCFSGRAGNDCSKLVCVNDKQCNAGQVCSNGVCSA